jgi:hypothetical protein
MEPLSLAPLPIRWGEGICLLRTVFESPMAALPFTTKLFSLAPSDGERVRERGSATWKNCILPGADDSSAREHFDALPIANRRYGRLQACATSLRQCSIVSSKQIVLFSLLPFGLHRYG